MGAHLPTPSQGGRGLLCGDTTPLWTCPNDSLQDQPEFSIPLLPKEVATSAPGAYSRKSLWFLSTEGALEITSEATMN